MAVKKIDKEFVISDSTVNCYSYRLLTSGYQLAEYQKNPIGYHMHDRDAGVLVRWEDLRVEGDTVVGKPVINMSNPRAAQTVAEIEDGFLNAASVGHIVALEWSDDAAHKMPGQIGPTVTKWYNRETSLVDIPGNYNALAKLYDEKLNELNLSDFTKNPKLMLGITLTAAHLSLLCLSATSSEVDVTKALNDLIAKAGEVDALKQKLSDLSATTTKKEVAALLEGGLTAKKITKELSDKLAVDYATNPTGLKALIDALPSQTLVVDQLNSTPKPLSDEMKSKTWEQLSESGDLEFLKANHYDFYKEKFKAEFGTEPKN